MPEQSIQIHSEQQTGLANLSNKSLALVQYPNKAELIEEIANLLQRLSLLYQVNNWIVNNSVTLAEWVYDNYKGYRINDVIECLKTPPTVSKKDGETENQWRLTPDTINKWMEIQIGKTEPIKQLMEEPELQPNAIPRPDLDKKINDLLKELQDSKVSAVPKLSREEIKKEGQTQPPRKKAAAYIPNPELIILHEKKMQWIRECTESDGGDGWRLKEGSPTFEVWLEGYKGGKD